MDDGMLDEAASITAAPLTRAFARARAVDVVVLVLLGFVARYAAYRLSPNIHFPDEIYQVMEPAHRLAFGQGYLAWEYIVGIRSWLLPGLVAGLMRLGYLFGAHPDTIRLPVLAFLLAASLTPVVCGYLWGVRFHGRPGGLLVGAILALWNDLLFIAPHPLTEAIAGDVLVVALYVASAPDELLTRRRLSIVGLLFGLTFILRFHLAPALFLAAVWLCRGQVRARWLPLLAGGLVPVLLQGLLDWATLGTPFQSIWWNFWLNIVANVSASFGTDSWDLIVLLPLALWGGATPVILGSACWAARRAPLLLVTALTIFVTHAVIAHKEVRFLFPALPLILVLAALATADVVDRLRRNPAPNGLSANSISLMALLLWIVGSIGVASSSFWHFQWTQRADMIAAFKTITREASSCAVAFVNLDWVPSPGSSGLPLGVPIVATSPEALSRDADGFDTLIVPSSIPVTDSRFHREACFPRGAEWGGGETCIWRRSGACAPGAAHGPAIQWPPYFVDGSGALIRERTLFPWQRTAAR